MDKRIAGLLGAVAGLATVGAAQAAIDPAAVMSLQPAAYADLLTPIVHPIALLQADDAARVQRLLAKPAADFEVAAAGDHHHHHYYHHHHFGYSRNYHHHSYDRRRSALIGSPEFGDAGVNRR